MGKGGGSAPAAEPSTTTQIQDIPAWEQGYVENLLGQAQTEAAQPYQQFNGPQIAGFTSDQTQAFNNIEGAGATNTANQGAAMGQAQAGANTANNIYNAGSGYINQATAYNPLQAVAPYLQAASGYNSANAAQPWLNSAASNSQAATQAASPQGIQSFLSPYTNNVVNGIENEANQNWNQNIMPGVNNEFIGSGGFGGGRSAQVLGQAAGNFQTGLSANVSNALQSGYTNAASEAATQAGILGNAATMDLNGANTASGAQSSQITNLLNQGAAAGTATEQQANNLTSAGTALGSLANTQATSQLNAGNVMSNIGAQSAATNLQQNNALQAVGQQQQQLNQSNLDLAKQNFETQVNYPEAQTEFLNQIVRGLPAPTSTTGASQTPAYSVSPLAGLGGAATTALSSLVGGNKEGGLIKGYAKGGKVTDDTDDDQTDDFSPLELANMNDDDSANSDDSDDSNVGTAMDTDVPPSDPSYSAADASPLSIAPMSDEHTAGATPSPLAAAKDQPGMISDSQSQKLQLLEMARGMLTPTRNGDGFAALGQATGNMADIQAQILKQNAAQQAVNSQRSIEQRRLDIMQQRADQYGTKGAGSTDTIARGLMKENPDLSYTQAVKQVMDKKIQANVGTTPQGTTPQGTTPQGTTSTGAIPSIPNATGSIPNAMNPDGTPVTTNQIQKIVSTLPQDYQDRLKQIPPDHMNTVIGILNGNIKPTKQVLGNDVQDYINEAEMVDPNYDSTKPDVRLQTALEFSQNKPTGKTITAMNAAARHSAQLALNFRDLGNTQTPLLNVPGNLMSEAGGSDKVGNTRTTISNLAPEMTKAVTGKPNFTGEEVKTMTKNFPINGSIEQQMGALNTQGHLASGKMAELQDRYNTDMGPFGAQKKVIPDTTSQTFQDIDTIHSAIKAGKTDAPEVKAAWSRLEKVAALPDPNKAAAPASAPAAKDYTKYEGQTLYSPSTKKSFKIVNGQPVAVGN